MRMLLFHAENYGARFDSFANRPSGIFLEGLDGKRTQFCRDCVVAFITVETKDEQKVVSSKAAEAIKKMCLEVGRKTAVVVPFAHLSNNIKEPKEGFEILRKTEKILKKLEIKTMRTHFGSNKSLHLDVYGHTGNARYREF